MAQPLQLCRALSTHAWEIVGPIVVLKGTARRITLHCARCDTWRFDTWNRVAGAILTRYYKHEQTYKSFIHDHTHAEARVAILASTKETSDETNHPRLRLLQTPTQKRHHHPRPHKRRKDKRWSAARSLRRP